MGQEAAVEQYGFLPRVTVLGTCLCTSHRQPGLAATAEDAGGYSLLGGSCLGMCQRLGALSAQPQERCPGIYFSAFIFSCRWVQAQGAYQEGFRVSAGLGQLERGLIVHT